MATINGDDGNNVLTGTEEEDIINGLGGNDTIDSVDRPSNIFAGSIDPRRDIVNAGTGDDFVTGGRLDQLDGGDGNDFLLLNFNFNGPVAGSATPITLTLDATGTGTASDGTSITGFESVNFNLSDTGDNVVNTGNVTTQITGGNGNDTLTTGSGDDFVFGGGGNNTISTGGGNDTIGAGSGNDVVSGGDGDDTFGVNVYTDGSDQVNLGAGNDTVRFDRFDGGTGNVRLTFTSAEVGNGNANDSGTLANQDGGLAVRVQAEAADGSLTGPISRYDDEGITFVAGTQGITFDVRDLVSGTARGNTFEGVVLGTNGNDALTFFPPFRSGQDFYYNAGQGNDTVTAGEGNDFLVGGAGNDTLSGGAGDDSFIGGAGNDVIDGGAGNDTANFNVSTDGYDFVNLGTGSDTVNVSAASPGQVRLTFTSAEVGNNNFFDSGTMANQDSGFAVRLQAENGSDGLTGSVSRFDDEGVSFVAAAGTTFDVRDLVAGTQRGDQFEVVTLGTSGADSLTAGQAGRSYYINAGMGNDTVTGGTANDFLVGGAGNDILNGAGGNDSFIGGAGDDRIIGGDGLDRAIFTGTLASVTLGRDANGFLTLSGADGTDTLIGIEQFQFSDRTIDTADGTPLVDDLYYLLTNRDVLASGQDADAHYAAYGAAEGRDPNAFFSTKGYLAANPDVAKAGVNPLTHYDTNGWKEGRDPGARFDNEFYLARNADVAAAGLNPLEHYLQYGQAEGRAIFDAVGRADDIKGGFDAEFYLLLNTDVAQAAQTAGGDTFAFARQHFETSGWKEGRDPNAVFDTKGYLAAYGDVAAAGVNPLAHYDTYGWKEGRDPSTDFDTTAYLAVNGDVAAAGIDPLQHYLQYGLIENRSVLNDGTFGFGANG